MESEGSCKQTTGPTVKRRIKMGTSDILFLPSTEDLLIGFIPQSTEASDKDTSVFTCVPSMGAI